MIIYYLLVFQRTFFVFSFGVLFAAILGIFFPPTPFWLLGEISMNMETIPLFIKGIIPWITLIGTFRISFEVALKDFKRRHYI
ncbi:hypothetical protein [Acinetobacter zhairhuonensis]|uniref:hypothetical protein n=1 Tax=Acinetobacter sp. A7.4 TaxID=2919921 RepID=UPI001F4F6BFE|nr:hypothetical protein [Acinetobacter sp. A7.4]MCJ8162324.1 hypothetical protein [Acinetobacter sp. A7.4]